MTMKVWIIALAVAASTCTGCTMMSLERHTVGQIDSAIDLRYHEILDNLAMIADDPSTIPNYCSIFCGTPSVQDTGQVVSTTTLPSSVRSQVLNPSFSRQVSQNWTLDPIMVPEKLEAIRACCQWAIGGREHVYEGSISLLIRPEDAPPGSERHFGVLEQLEALPAGWLGTGSRTSVPNCARYKAHCRDTWVWVTPEGMKGLTDFTLIIQNIARVQINSPTLFHFPPYYTPISFLTSDPESGGGIKVGAQVVVDQTGKLQTNFPYVPLRFETSGVDSALRSAISAAGISSVPH
jgi:hypothetical protein